MTNVSIYRLVSLCVQLVTSADLGAKLRKYFTGSSLIYGSRFQAFLNYFSFVSQLLLNYFSIISHFSFICLFHGYFSLLNNFLLIFSQMFPKYLSFPNDASHFSVTLPNYFLVKVRIFPLYIASWYVRLDRASITWCDSKIKIIILRVLRCNGSSRLPCSSVFLWMKNPLSSNIWKGLHVQRHVLSENQLCGWLKQLGLKQRGSESSLEEVEEAGINSG